MEKEVQKKLNQIRRIIRSCAPKAEEIISYGMPTFKLNGKAFVAFCAFKKHIGFFPMSGYFLNHFEKELMGYEKTKGGVHFSLDKPVPVLLIKKLVKARIKMLK